MLSLSRQPGETIVATTARGERIEFTVLRCQAGRTSVGVSAPQSVRIDREEIDRKRNKESSND